MTSFICLLSPHSQTIPDEVRRRYESTPRRRGIEIRWQFAPGIAALVGDSAHEAAPRIVRSDDHIAVGVVRLDNRDDLERWSECRGAGLRDLELVARTLIRHGTKYMPEILGDFAFVVYDTAKRVVYAACDAFATKRLYYAEREGMLAFASRADLIASDTEYDAEYLARMLAGHPVKSGSSPFAGIHMLPAATFLFADSGGTKLTQYWSAADWEPDFKQHRNVEDTVNECRELFVKSIRLRQSEHGRTWAQLSGGLDSSSVVSTTQWLAETRGTRAIDGTLTYAHRPGTTADEQAYAASVVRRWPHRNEKFVDPPLWHNDGCAPPESDLPDLLFPYYPREQIVAELLRNAGATVLLTGVASDELFTGNMLFFADWMARGRVWPAIREMARRAAIGRISFWDLAYRNAIAPLWMSAFGRSFARPQEILPLASWFRPSVAQRYGLRDYGALSNTYGQVGHLYHGAQVQELAHRLYMADLQVLSEVVDIRHPFYYRPLVEFALQLPPEFCAQPQARKWILREAMRGILPDEVRTRIGKGGAGDLISQEFLTHGRLLTLLAADPILADLGIVDGRELEAACRLAVDQPELRADHLHELIIDTLAIEAWLKIRSGRWPRECSTNIASAVETARYA